MEFLGTALRWLQLTNGLVLLGSFAVLLLAGPGRSPDAARWRAAILAAAPWLVALLLARVNDLSVDELAQLDMPDWFAQLGLGRQLSPSRSNGLQAVLTRMQHLLDANDQGAARH